MGSTEVGGRMPEISVDRPWRPDLQGWSGITWYALQTRHVMPPGYPLPAIRYLTKKPAGSRRVLPVNYGVYLCLLLVEVFLLVKRCGRHDFLIGILGEFLKILVELLGQRICHGIIPFVVVPRFTRAQYR